MQDNPFSNIEGLRLTEAQWQALKADGISAPSPIQRDAIGPILAGKHVVMASGTGTGKTLAYLLPVLQRLEDDPQSRAVIFAPGAELAMQTLRVAEAYKAPSITTGALIASGNRALQKSQVQKSTRLIVGTPGRILEMYAARKLKRVTMIVLDEPEPILSSSHADFLREVLSRPEPKVQLVFAAATMGPRSERLAQDVMGPNAVHIAGGQDPLHSDITHQSYVVRDGQAKDVRLARFIEENCKRAIVFANQPQTLRHLFRYFSEHNLRPVTLMQERPKKERQKAVAQFAKAEARVLLATDMAARGLDIPDVRWVLHYDLPTSAQAYVHRAGRTGRAGRKGNSVAFLHPSERALLNRYAKELRLSFTSVHHAPEQ